MSSPLPHTAPQDDNVYVHWSMLALECNDKVYIVKENEEFMIGSLPENHLSVKGDPHVSRKHARIWNDSSGWQIEDKGSTNGTWLGADKVTKMPIRPGQSFRFGKTMVRIHEQHDTKLPGVFSVSPAMNDVIEEVYQAAQTDLSVLFAGEPGTGKTLFSKLLHRMGRRSAKTFKKYNCASRDDARQLEADLFGHVRGAYTGATGKRTGMLRDTQGGTILLDEIGELDIRQQAKLLDVIEDRMVRPLGDDKSYEVDVRILGATNQDVYTVLRDDLFERFPFHIEIPPLRKRPEDIPYLIKYYLNGHRISDLIINKLQKLRWVGNVRELKNFVNTAVQTQRLSDQQLMKQIRQLKLRWAIKALRRTGGNKTRTAELLEISRPTLQDWLEG